MKKLLIVYYSWSNGNTERIAKELQSVAGGDLLKIDTAVPYSGSYDEVVDQGQREVNRGYLATSCGSDMGKTNKKLAPSCPGAKLLHGKVLNGNPSKADLSAWVETLSL